MKFKGFYIVVGEGGGGRVLANQKGTTGMSNRQQIGLTSKPNTCKTKQHYQKWWFSVKFRKDYFFRYILVDNSKTYYFGDFFIFILFIKKYYLNIKKYNTNYALSDEGFRSLNIYVQVLLFAITIFNIKLKKQEELWIDLFTHQVIRSSFLKVHSKFGG